MRDTIMRVRLPTDLYKEYKKLCVDLDLSLPAQTESLICNFVTIHKQNKAVMK